jgi:hypothetical protein
LARSAEEIEAVQRLRYDVYVGELGRYRSVADHDARRFAEPEDERSWLLYACDGDEVVATTRLSWGGAGFSVRQIEQYELGPWLDELPGELLVVGERAAVHPSRRGTGVLEELLAFGSPLATEHDVHVAFGCCEPHLLPLYISMGQQPYATRNINSDEAGYLIPLVAFVPDVEALRGRSRTAGPDALPACVDRVATGRSSVHSSSLVDPGEYWAGIRRVLDDLHAERVLAFDDLTDDEAGACAEHSNVIDCAAGDRVLKAGGSARNMFVVLAGTLEVRDGGRLLGVLQPGDVFGEMAFLLEQPRAFDVLAVSDAKVLSLSERSLRRLISSEPVAAAKLLLNVAKMLSARLIRAERSTEPLGVP